MNQPGSLKLATLLLVLTLSNTTMAQSPFSDQSVRISQSTGQTITPSLSPTTLWNGLKAAAAQTRKKAVAFFKELTQFGKTPEFVESSFKIPGHETKHFVCQGICYLPEEVVNPATDQESRHESGITLLSYYPKTDKTNLPAQIVAIDSATGRPLRRFSLFQSDDKPYTGHAGGIAVAGKYLWVASGYNLYGFPVQNIIDFIKDDTALAETAEQQMPPTFMLPEQKLTASQIFSVDSTASYVSFGAGHLWVGDFVKSSDKKYSAIKHHASNQWNLTTWIAGYKVDSSGKPTAKTTYKFTADGKSRKVHQPDKVILCRESVQGMAVCDDYVALSISYGAKNSKLALYRNPLNQQGTALTYKPEGQEKSFSTQAWVLAGKNNWSKTVELAAGSEDLEYDGSRIYVTFEGASKNYRTRWSLNPLVKIEEKFYLISLKKLMGQ